MRVASGNVAGPGVVRGAAHPVVDGVPTTRALRGAHRLVAEVSVANAALSNGNEQLLRNAEREKLVMRKDGSVEHGIEPFAPRKARARASAQVLPGPPSGTPSGIAIVVTAKPARDCCPSDSRVDGYRSQGVPPADVHTGCERSDQSSAFPGRGEIVRIRRLGRGEGRACERGDESSRPSSAREVHGASPGNDRCHRSIGGASPGNDRCHRSKGGASPGNDRCHRSKGGASPGNDRCHRSIG